MLANDHFPLHSDRENSATTSNFEKSQTQFQTSSYSPSDKSSALETKEQIEQKYRKLISLLTEVLQDVDKINASNPALQNAVIALSKQLNSQISEIRRSANSTLNEMPWDKLVIAFFGETNAGKSTIIETFRILFDDHRKKNQDGLIVGDGRNDFTKDYHEYPLYINGKPLVLIDVPGIEGDEAEYKDSIMLALKKAHFVFYIQGHNKKPDEATAIK